MIDCDHDFNLWTPMYDGTGRESRHCKKCKLIRTRKT